MKLFSAHNFQVDSAEQRLPITFGTICSCRLRAVFLSSRTPLLRATRLVVGTETAIDI